MPPLPDYLPHRYLFVIKYPRVCVDIDRLIRQDISNTSTATLIKERIVTYYCVQCKRATAPYDLWPDHIGTCCRPDS